MPVSASSSWSIRSGEDGQEYLDSDDTMSAPSPTRDEYVHPFFVLPEDILMKVFALLDPVQLILFADSSRESRRLVDSTSGIQLQLVVSYSINPQMLYLDTWSSSWFDRWQTGEYLVGRSLADESRKRSVAFSTLVSLLNTNIAKRFEIDISDCAVSTVSHFLSALCTAFPNRRKKVFDNIVIKARDGTSKLQCGGEAPQWAGVIERIGEVFPCRHLSILLSCACGRVECTFIGNTLYAHWNTSHCLLSLTGHLRSKFDLFDGSFPSLCGFADHSTYRAADADARLTVLSRAQKLLRKWHSGRLPRFFFMSSVEWKIAAIREDIRYKRFTHYLAQFEKDFSLQGDWGSVNYDTIYLIPRSDGNTMSVRLIERNDKLTVECYEREKEEAAGKRREQKSGGWPGLFDQVDSRFIERVALFVMFIVYTVVMAILFIL